jgi:hypothetical protein
MEMPNRNSDRLGTTITSGNGRFKARRAARTFCARPREYDRVRKYTGQIRRSQCPGTVSRHRIKTDDTRHRRDTSKEVPCPYRVRGGKAAGIGLWDAITKARARCLRAKYPTPSDIVPKQFALRRKRMSTADRSLDNSGGRKNPWKSANLANNAHVALMAQALTAAIRIDCSSMRWVPAVTSSRPRSGGQCRAVCASHTRDRHMQAGGKSGARNYTPAVFQTPDDVARPAELS